LKPGVDLMFRIIYGHYIKWPRVAVLLFICWIKNVILEKAEVLIAMKNILSLY